MQDLIALVIVIFTAWWLVRHFTRVAKTGQCGSGCDCAQDATRKTSADDRGLKKTPIIEPENIGRPAISANDRHET